MFDVKTILPAEADNQYQGSSIALYFFVLFVVIMTCRSIVHMFFSGFGLHEIANLVHFDGEPDPSRIIHLFFSLWGFSQLIFCLVCWVGIWKYRSLVPAFYMLWMLEWGGRAFLYPIFFVRLSDGAYSKGIAPGAEFAPHVFLCLVLFFLLSLKRKKPKPVLMSGTKEKY